MKSLQPTKKWRPADFRFFIILGLLWISGCGFPLTKATVPGESIHEKDRKILEQANQHLLAGDTENAQQIFFDLHKSTTNPLILRRSLYGLACTGLLLAQTVEEFERALALLDKWNQMVPQSLGSEDPRMLQPLVESRLAELKASRSKIKALKSRVLKLNHQNFQDRDQKFNTLKQQLKEKTRKIDQQKKRIDNLEAQIQTLKEQIKALETIDQKIQEKKKEISSP